MVKTSPILWMLLLFISIQSCDKPQTEKRITDPLELNRVGLAILTNSFDRHGGDFMMRDSGTVSIEVNNFDYRHLGQSVDPLPPFESYRWERQFFKSFDSNIEKSWFRQEVSGFVFENFHWLEKEIGYEYDNETKFFVSDNTSRLAGLDVIPHTYLRTAIRNPLGVVFVRKDSMDGRLMNVVQANSKGLIEFWVDDDSGLVTKIHALGSSLSYGIVHRIYTFRNYFNDNQIQFPRETRYDLITNVMDTITNIFTINSLGKNITLKVDSVSIEQFKPADYSDRPNSIVAQLADGVWLYQNITNVSSGHSYNVLFAEFEDFILVCEAPVDSPTSEQVIKIIEKYVPGKPIRYLIQSHHHNDHLAGIRTYVAHDVAIVTTQPNAKLIQAIADASFAHAPDRQEERRKQPKFEMVSGKKWSISDKSMAVEVYDIGPTLHAKEMLVTYFPKQGIMFQSDMILYKENPHNTPLNREFAEWLRKSNLKLSILAGAHGYTMRQKEITSFIESRLPQTFGAHDVK